MILQRQLAVSRLDLLIAGFPAHTENLVIISLRHWIHCILRSHRDPHHGGPQKFSFEIIAALELAEDRLVFGLVGRDTLSTAWCTLGSNGLPAVSMGSTPDLLEGVEQALVDQLDAFGVIGVGGFDLQGALEIVEDGQDLPHQIHGGELQIIGPLALGAAARIVEFGAGAQQAILQFGLFGGKLIAFGSHGGDRSGDVTVSVSAGPFFG